MIADVERKLEMAQRDWKRSEDLGTGFENVEDYRQSQALRAEGQHLCVKKYISAGKRTTAACKRTTSTRSRNLTSEN